MQGVREIQLTQGYKAIIDEGDYDMISLYSWHVADVHGNLYAARTIAGQKQYMHRLIAGNGTGKVDHRNGDGLDNRRANLRSATDSQQQANRGKQKGNHTSQYKGVCFRTRNGKWLASIKVKGKSLHLGYFPTEEAAALAYNEAAAIYFGEFARLNEVANV